MAAPHRAGGLAYLNLITSLLQRARLADDTAGLFEAADLQWWWRRDQHPDPADAVFWLDDRGDPIAAVVMTDWGDRWGCDVIDIEGDRHAEGPTRAELWHHALERVAHLGPRRVDTSIRDDDAVATAAVGRAGFLATDEVFVECWMPTEERPGTTALADGHRLVTRATHVDRPHHMIGRTGPQVAQHLLECSLYDPTLDLAIEGPDGDIVAYGLFWADPVTGVGLVEPMRTEDAHQGRGLAGHVLTAGLDLLAERGCRRTKVSYIEGNDHARRLYLHAGFRPGAASRTHTLQP